ncbi:hypothetical protein Tco_0566617 [Tanacetum coccineum]
MTIPFPSRLSDYYCEEKKGSYGPQISEAYSYKASHIDKFIPQKEKDPGSFNLPCYINNVCFDNALANLGASVSVMPLSIYLNLGLGELAHTKLTVELADKTVKYPKGIAKNVLVGIGKFVFPVDFIILDIPEDVKVPLILKRPFLSTAHAKIDVFKRKITLRVGVEKIIFKSVKPASSLIKRVYMLSLRERMEHDPQKTILYLLIVNGKLGVERYQQKVNLTASIIYFLGIDKYKMFSIVSEPVYGIIYKNSKKEKRVMRHQEVYKFYDATLKKVLEGLKCYNINVKKGYVTPSLNKEDVEYLTFHVSNLKKCLSDESLVLPLDEIQVDDKHHFVEVPVEIIDLEVKRLK